MTDKRKELIRELEKLHKEQRGWQRLVNDEQLNYELLEKMPLEALEEAVKRLRGVKKMKKRCKYCGAKASDVCQYCKEKMAIIKRIKSMLK